MQDKDPDKTTSAIKDIVYDEISKNNAEIESAISSRKFAGVTKSLLAGCLQKIARVGGDTDDVYCTLAEIMLHYLLTNALIPSQRKITVDGTYIDIVIPDARVLTSSPKDALVLCFARSGDGLAGLLPRTHRVQPVRENVWIIARNAPHTDYRTYEIAGKASFVNLLDDIEEFTSSRTRSGIKIFKIGS